MQKLIKLLNGTLLNIDDIVCVQTRDRQYGDRQYGLYVNITLNKQNFVLSEYFKTSEEAEKFVEDLYEKTLK